MILRRRAEFTSEIVRSISPARGHDAARLATLVALFAFGLACARPAALPTSTRPFDFERDTFAYTNDNYWVYDLEADSTGPVVKERLDDVAHGQRCTIMSRMARQFFYAARFEPDSPRVSALDYRKRIERVLASDPRADRPAESPVVFPGYADLRSLSEDHEALMKETLGGRWTGYFQRGNWRMIFPFHSSQNRATARELVADIRRGHLPLVHVLNYPSININHTVLLYAVEETPLSITFDLYDPNNAKQPGSLRYDRASAKFRYYRTDYFAGGLANVYEIYDGLFY